MAFPPCIACKWNEFSLSVLLAVVVTAGHAGEVVVGRAAVVHRAIPCIHLLPKTAHVAVIVTFLVHAAPAPHDTTEPTTVVQVAPAVHASSTASATQQMAIATKAFY